MGDIGLEGAYGGVGMSDALNQAQNLRLKLWQLSEQQRIANTELGQRQQGLDETHADRLARIADTNSTAKAADQTRMLNFANLRPIGSNVTPQEYTKETVLGNPTGNYATTPSLPATRTAGLTSLAPGLTSMGTEAPPQAPTQQAAVTSQAPIDPLGKISFGGTQAQLEKVAGDKRADTAHADNIAHQQAVLDQTAQNNTARNDTAQQMADIRQQVADRPPKEPTQHFVAQDRILDGKPVAGTLNTNTGVWTAHPEQGSVHPAAGAAGAATEARHKAEAIDTLNQVDQAINEAQQFLGPGAGRVTSIEQMIGLADPRAQKLGTKLLIGKMKVDAAIGGVRAAASPQLLQRWDNLLGTHVTPDGLRASVQALREVMGGTSAPAAAAGGGGPTVGTTRTYNGETRTWNGTEWVLK